MRSTGRPGHASRGVVPPLPGPVTPVAWLRSVGFWTYLALSLPLWWVGAVAIWVATAPFDPQRRALHAYTCVWGSHYIRLSPAWQLRVEGRDRLAPGQPFVMVSNHQSAADILAIFGLRRHFKWVAKKEAFRPPFIGWNMRMNDYVEIDRGDRRSAERMLDRCARHLERGSPVMMFPEGTRSRDGRIRRFKHGAFTLASETGVPVVPIVVEGTRDALPKRSLVLRGRGRFSVRVLEPLDPADFGSDAAALRRATRHRIATALAELRGVPVDEVIVREAEGPGDPAPPPTA